MDRSDLLYTQLLEASKQRTEANISAHKLRAGRIKDSVRERKALQQVSKQTPVPKVPLDFLAIGDS